MLGIRQPTQKHRHDEAEKPFWISYSDLMTALTVLFLVAMAVALMAVTTEISEADKKKIRRDEDIDSFITKVRAAVEEFPGVSIHGRTVDFGDRARFESDKHKLTIDQARLLRAVAPKILAIARDPEGTKWFKRVVVEGFADQRGTYIHNLNLSLQRSERVLCVLLASPHDAPDALTEEDRRAIREMFLVGGSSFNSLREGLEESRRIELKLEFLDIGEMRPVARDVPLDDDARCPVDL